MSERPLPPGEANDAWLAARLGKVTASRMADIAMTTKKGDFYASRKKYMIELIAEQFTGMPTESYLNAAMLWGVETEPQAIAAYEKRTGLKVDRSPFVDHPRLPMAGCSPDGCIGEDGLIEVKCPETRTHIAYLIDKVIPEEYMIQMQWQMACVGARWCEFISYDPRLPSQFAMMGRRVLRDDAKIADLERKCAAFLLEMEAAIETIHGRVHVPSEDIEPPAQLQIETQNGHIDSADIL